MTPQVWEQRIPGTDIPIKRLHLDVDDEGRVRVHEAVLEQLLTAAGWQPVDDPTPATSA